MARKKNTETKRPIESYDHRDKERVNNPPVGLVTPQTDPDAGQNKKRYAYDPHLDPQLVWAGKAEHTSFEVPTVSLHVHERIDPRTIIEAVRRVDSGQGIVNSGQMQLPLFEEERKEPLRQAIEFYRHKHGWSNRLIAGDSLLVMNSLLEKEGMAGKVQMIYLDPPYGIKYGSNFQPFVNKRDVKDGKDEDLTAEPEQIKAFRDTWELGIHSYLTYLRDRLLLARELLTESGSVFVQISDENVHHVRELMDEVFGAGNFVSLITFTKTTGFSAKRLDSVADYLLWYARNIETVKYRQLYVRKNFESEYYDFVEFPDGEIRKLTEEEKQDQTILATGSTVFASDQLTSQGSTASGSEPVEFRGQVFTCPAGLHWKTTAEGIRKLCWAGRVFNRGNRLRYKRAITDFSMASISNVWLGTQLGSREKVYVVQTASDTIQRCLLMTTDPGDLVFDPTCGSGTTAYVAEQWGRRWITCDTSRVALTLARQRLMTAVFDYYELAHPEEGVGSGFKYKTVPHVTLKSIANNPEIDGIYARMHPAIEQALADLNAALKALTPGPSPLGRGEKNPLPLGEGGRRPGEGYPRFEVKSGGRAGQFVDFAAPNGKTFRLPSGQEVSAGALLEWEVPFAFPEDWPDEARPAFERFHRARRAMQNEIDAAIARHAPQETLYDQPLVDRKKVRVTGPFTVEAVPAPAVKSVDELLPSPQPSATGRGSEENPLPSGEGRGEGAWGEGKKPLDPELLKFARQLRKEQTDAERLLWALLRNRRLAGFKFRRQQPVEPYVLDFYCHEARLAVELDGGQHNEPDERARDSKRTAFLEEQGIRVLRFWNNEVLTNTEGVLQAIYNALMSLTPTLSQGERGVVSQGERGFEADASIARSGETLRQAEWRDELLRTGIRGKAGQYIRFARLEPLPGCRWLHADGETRPSDEGADGVREEAPAYNPMRVVVSFGPEHGPLEQRQVAQAIEEAQTLVPRPKLIVFAAFQFDPEAAKDIDKTNWPGVTLLKAQMNADLLTDDLKKKRASNESFWLIGQPDVVAVSEQWIVNSRKEVLAPYDVVAKLSGARSLAEVNGLGRDDLSAFIAIAQRRDLWDALAADAGGGVDSGEHRRRPGEAQHRRVSSVPERRAGLPSRIGDADDFVREIESLAPRERAKRIERLRGSREIADRAREIAASLTGPLSTIHYSQVTIHGFDYYNTKTGAIESGSADKIAVWLLDTDYDGRSLYPRQVFFPMAGENEGWARLAKSLKAEIDEDLIEAYRGTVSLPFEAGEHKRIAVKIVDDRGIESLKVLEVE